MKPERWAPARDGPPDEAALRQRLEGMGYRVTRHVYPPGTVFATHRHAEDKMDAVVHGQLRITMKGETAVLGPGDAVRVPRGVAHSAEVVGDEPVVSLDGVRDPGWP